MGVISSLGAVGAFSLLTAMEAFVGMVFLDFTAALKSEGLVSQERWDRLIDDIAPQLRGIFRVGTLIPIALMLMALSQFFVAWKAGRRATMSP